MGKSKDKKDQTESSRLMRGAWHFYFEYIPELRNDLDPVGCDGVVFVTHTGVLIDTRRGMQRELFANKGGNTG